MKGCPYCGYSNYDSANECRKCQAPLVPQAATLYHAKSFWVGPQKSHTIRNKAISAVVLGLVIMVYWGGYGPWPVIDNPNLANLRAWLEPCLLYGGAAGYVGGWLLRWV